MIFRGRHRIVALQFAIGLIAAYWIVAIFLTPYELAAFTDGHGYQLAGGAEILAGRHPFIDFRDQYGPLTFYASAIAQALSGGGLFGELALNASAIAVGLALLFGLMRTLTIPPRIALPMTLVAVLAAPAPYRYYLLLGPMLFLSAAFRYTRQPRIGWLALAALAATLTGLFRPDFGVYTCLAGVALFTAQAPVDGHARVRRTATFLALVFLWAVPWLIWLGLHGKLGEYLFLSSFEALHKAAAFPRDELAFDFADGLFTVDNFRVCFARLPFVVFLLALGAAALGWRSLDATARARLAGVLTFAGISLLQVSHRVDWMHVRDVLPTGILLLAWIIAQAWPAHDAQTSCRPMAPTAAILAVGLSLTIAIGALVKEKRHSFTPAAVARKIAAFRGTLPEIVARFDEEEDPYHVARFIAVMRAETLPTDPLFVLIEGPQLNYFCSRPLVGGQFAILPGYFNSEARQREFIAALEAQPRVFVFVTLRAMDDRPASRLEVFAPLVDAYLERRFARLDRFGHYMLFGPHGVSLDPSVPAAPR